MAQFVPITLLKGNQRVAHFGIKEATSQHAFLAFDHELYPHMKNPNKIPKEVLSTPLATRRASE